MAVTIIERPGEINFSRNPIRYALQTNTSLATPGLRIDVRILYKIFQGGTYEALLEVPLTPDSNGRVDIDLNKIIDSLLTYKLPTITSNLVSSSFEQVCQFYISYREITTAAPDPAWTDDAGGTRFATKGGLPYQLWKGSNYFINYAAANKPFLTWQKSGRSIGPDEISWLTYLHLLDDTTNVSAKVSIYYTDGTSTVDAVTLTFPETDVYKYGLYQIPAGITQLGLADVDPAKQIEYYGIKVVNAATTLKQNYFFYIDYRHTYNTTAFNYFNSLGGFDSVRILGDITREARYESEAAETTVDAAYYNENELVPMQFTQQVTEQIIFKGSVGLMDDDYEMDVKRDLRISKGVYEAKYEKWWLVNLLNNQVNIGSIADPVKDFPIEWTYGIVNENYAPDQNVGDLPACPLITGITYEVPTLSWDTNSAHASYIIEVREQTTPSTALVITFIYTSNAFTTISAGTLYKQARIKAVCSGSQSAWSNFTDLFIP